MNNNQPNNMTLEQSMKFAIEQHKSTNHYYDKYLPYEFHLRMVVSVATDFLPLVSLGAHNDILAACWMHDLIEDCRCTYNDVKQHSNREVAEIVRACTNYTRGRNRAERMPFENYNDILNTRYALFVKLCDRIANVQYSKMTKSKMFEMYQKEHETFCDYLKNKDTYDSLRPMWDMLDELLKH